MSFLSAVLSCAVRLDGMIVGIKLLTVPQAHFLWEAFDLGAVSSSKRFEWVKMNLDMGAAVHTFPLNFGPDGAGGGRFFGTASGECILDGGGWQLEGYQFFERKSHGRTPCFYAAREKLSVKEIKSSILDLIVVS